MQFTRILFAIGSVICLGACTPAAEVAESEVPVGSDRVLKLEELTFTDIDKIDREKSIFFLTFGNLEQHGPHLPVGADYYQALGIRDRLVARLQEAYPDYTMVVVPVIPLGEGSADDSARQFDQEHWPGTFALRFTTLRDVAIDLGASIARKGFRNIFLIHNHGAELHNLAFNQASAFVSEKYQALMVNITSLVFGEGFNSGEILDRHLGEGWQEEIGITGHAGTGETSTNLFLHDLVKPEYKDLEPFVVKEISDIDRLHERWEGWQGYWSDPSRATSELGEDLINDRVERSFLMAQRVLSGEDISQLPVFPHSRPSTADSDVLVQLKQENYAQKTAEIEAWLEKNQPAF